MERDEFVRIHAECEKSLKEWIAEATRTCRMLGECLDKPLTLEQRSELHRQRSRENEAQSIHWKNRQKLFELARSGYGDYELVYGPLPDK
jgi:hypothetical protein